jgi:hypothetical protein
MVADHFAMDDEEEAEREKLKNHHHQMHFDEGEVEWQSYTVIVSKLLINIVRPQVDMFLV